VLVTGGCGFIGSHLAEALVTAGARVTVLDNLQSGRPENLDSIEADVRSVIGDVRDSRLVRNVVRQSKPEIVFHLAANASVPGSVTDPIYDFETNCHGTVVLLDALRQAGGCRKFVLASSGAVYGEPERLPIREDAPLRPISPYGASKLAAETEALIFHRVYGVPVVVARIFNVYGPRMARFVVLDFLRKLRQDPSILEILGTGRQVRDFNYVTDAVHGLLLLADTAPEGEVYNLSSGTACSVTELAHHLIDGLALEPRPRLVYSQASWTGDAQRWEVSIEKIAAAGYTPRVTLSQGLRRVAEWFDEEHTERERPEPIGRFRTSEAGRRVRLV
jgi:UDP-glucose 4-epimerase